jgi:multiple sugar transport system permease protein
VFFFLANWNSFMWPLVSTTSQNLWMLQEGIASFTGEYGSAWNEILAASTIAAIPTIALFALFQKQIVSSLKTSGIK